MSFPHNWKAEVLAARPVILPARSFVYPREAEEVERGALEILVRPAGPAQPFLATCAVGFLDAAAPTGIWSAPDPAELCSVSGGYAYIIDTNEPQRFTMIPYRPVLGVHAVPNAELLLFVGHRNIFAWGAQGQAWETGKLSDEGLTIVAIDNNTLHGRGWHMMSDKETPFTVDLRTGAVLEGR
jgi:hypothetical protein